MTWEQIALGLFVAAGGGVLVPIVALMKHRDYSLRIARMPAATEFEDLQTRLTLAQQKVKDLHEQEVRRDRAVAEADEAAARLVQILEDLQTLEPKRLELSQVLEQLATENEKLADVLQRKIEAEANIEQYLHIRQLYEAERREHEQKIKQWEDAIAECQRRHQELSVRNQDIAQQLDRLERELESKRQRSAVADSRLAEQNREIDELREARKVLRDNIDLLEQQKAELQATKNALHRYLEHSAEQDGKQEAAALADLKRPPPCLSEAGLTDSRGPVDEKQALADLQQYLADLGLRFPSRTLNAFHTCLKINDLSPLTVLAGISGTGKSELPRRYAEGMGMHFLQMAVQPRWDSPQDLFGFYNYLEHRYIATDLARALAHLDHYNHDDLAGPWQDRTLLVLLDEMNLARVEYYFSEFLSRLEVRKSVAVKDLAKRMAAEIQLDIGGREKPFNLYVDRNVLFVGTMNEDESTQTLSDKVIDRANVLRFGRPQTLADQQPGDAGIHNRRFLSRKTWGGWWRTIDTLDSHDRERLPQWIKRLNDAMEGLERPFAHRINQAILLYCANYPGEGRARVDHAFADQLEQRILPKLRGIDTSEFSDPLGQLQTLIEETGDKALAMAMETARKRALFSFQGVNRQD